MFPVGNLVLGSIPWRWSALPLFVLMVIAGAVLGAVLGLVLGTLVKPHRINIVFSLVFTPLLFTGCSQYPWPSLARLRWFQVVTAANPMTYVSEGLRGALVPNGSAHRAVDLPARARWPSRVARRRPSRLLPPRHRLTDPDAPVRRVAPRRQRRREEQAADGRAPGAGRIARPHRGEHVHPERQHHLQERTAVTAGLAIHAVRHGHARSYSDARRASKSPGVPTRSPT